MYKSSNVLNSLPNKHFPLNFITDPWKILFYDLRKLDFIYNNFNSCMYGFLSIINYMNDE